VGLVWLLRTTYIARNEKQTTKVPETFSTALFTIAIYQSPLPKAAQMALVLATQAVLSTGEQLEVQLPKFQHKLGEIRRMQNHLQAG
jgi:hypothetical protein